MHIITLQQIRDQHPCCEGWSKLLKSLGNPEDLSVQVSFGDIAKSNGAADALWCACCVNDRRFIVSMVMPTVKRASKHATDQRVHDCLAALERWLAGDGPVDVSAEHAAYAAALAATLAATQGGYSISAAYYAAHAVRAAYAAVRADDADAAGIASEVARAAYRAADAANADVATRAASAADAEHQQQVEDIIAVSPLYALK